MKYFNNTASLALARLLPNQTVGTDGDTTAGDEKGAIYYITFPQATGSGDVVLANSNIAVYQGSFKDAVQKSGGNNSTQDIIDEAVLASQDALRPIGSLFEYTIDDTNPATLLGFGVWSKYGAGRFLVGQTDLDVDFQTPGDTGGAKTHQLTEDEMPAHTHPYHAQGGLDSTNTKADHVEGSGSLEADRTGRPYTTDSVGISSHHNNLPPYIVAYRWVRTA